MPRGLHVPMIVIPSAVFLVSYIVLVFAVKTEYGLALSLLLAVIALIVVVRRKLKKDLESSGSQLWQTAQG